MRAWVGFGLRRAILIGLLGGLSQVRAADEGAVLLVAHPAFEDRNYYHSVLLATPVPKGGHVGVIINRPTGRRLSALFPEHAPSQKVVDPVYFGGPFAPRAVVALVRSESSPGADSVRVTQNVFLAFRAATIDSVIEARPNSARYYVGYVGWSPGELKREIEHGLWAVLDPDIEAAFRKNPNGLWEELQEQTHRLRAVLPHRQRLAAVPVPGAHAGRQE